MSKLILLLMPYSTGHTVVSFQYVLWKKDSIFTIRLYNIVQGEIIEYCTNYKLLDSLHRKITVIIRQSCTVSELKQSGGVNNHILMIVYYMTDKLPYHKD